MIHLTLVPEEIVKLKDKIKERPQLIHYITHPIVMNDCANVILGLGARPIMAEHPLEVEEITAQSNALGVNLGNISDSRMTAIERSAWIAFKNKIPWCIDLVGVGCSTMRRSFAKKLITQYKPWVIKGNMSEIKAICGLPSHACGIDVGSSDTIEKQNLQEEAIELKRLASETGAVIVGTGKIDLVSTSKETYACYNGSPMLGKLTGTGCMLTGMIATYLSGGLALKSSLLAVTMMGIAGERASGVKGNGSFRVALLDELYSMETETLLEMMKYELVEE